MVKFFCQAHSSYLVRQSSISGDLASQTTEPNRNTESTVQAESQSDTSTESLEIKSPGNRMERN